jgi:hypothetical protein
VESAAGRESVADMEVSLTRCDRIGIIAPLLDAMKAAALGVLLVLASTHRAHAQTWTQQARLLPSDPVQNAAFGQYVSLEGDTALVGAPFANSVKGSAYVFVRSGGVWTQQAELTAPGGVAGDEFGYPVAISGNTALVGAPNRATSQGSAYVFVRSGTTWTFQQQLTATGGMAYDGFGTAVALLGDTAMVAAAGANSQTGSVYVFNRAGTVWSQSQSFAATDSSSGSFFGNAISLNATTAVVGALGQNNMTGAAYIFTLSGGAWRQTAEIVGSDSMAGDFFGSAVALSGSTALVGAYRRPGPAGVDAGVPTAGAELAGAAYVFSGNSSSWIQTQELTAPDPSSDNEYGFALAIGGNTAIIGNGYGTPHVYFYKNGAAGWSLQEELNSTHAYLGSQVALSGNTSILSEWNDPNGSIVGAGAAVIFTAPAPVPAAGQLWPLLVALLAVAGYLAASRARPIVPRFCGFVASEESRRNTRLSLKLRYLERDLGSPPSPSTVKTRGSEQRCGPVRPASACFAPGRARRSRVRPR